MDYKATCPNCGEKHCIMETTYLVDGIKKCHKCLNLNQETQPCFIQHIPNYVDGAEVKVFMFENKDELFSKHPELDDDMIYVYSGDALMKQSLSESFWWVLGFIRNFDLKDLDIPEVNYDIYNDDKTVNVEKVEQWLGR